MTPLESLQEGSWVTPFTVVGSAVVGWVLVGAGLSKIADRAGFREVTSHYVAMPSRIVPLISVVVPYVEIGVGASLAFGFAAEVSMRLAAGLFGLFAVLVLANLIAGEREVSCGCLGSLSSSRLSATHVVVNSLLAVGLVFLAASTSSLGSEAVVLRVLAAVFYLAILLALSIRRAVRATAEVVGDPV